jgi:hypothetical protein
MSVCTHCGGSGWAEVPHRDFVVVDEYRPQRWSLPPLSLPVFVKESVTCVCEKGLKTHEKMRARAGLNSRAMPCSLDEYRRKVHARPEQLLAQARFELDKLLGTLRPNGSMFDQRDLIDYAQSTTVPL